MLDSYFHLHHVESVFFTDLSNQTYRSFLNVFSLEDLLPVFPAPYQLVTRIVDRITRSFDGRAWLISCHDPKTYDDTEDAPLPLYDRLGKACIHCRDKPQSILQEVFIKKRLTGKRLPLGRGASIVFRFQL